MINFTCMFIYLFIYFCLSHTGLTVNVKFNMSKVAYLIEQLADSTVVHNKIEIDKFIAYK